jgi:hypothetical protein
MLHPLYFKKLIFVDSDVLSKLPVLQPYHTGIYNNHISFVFILQLIVNKDCYHMLTYSETICPLD